MQKRPIILRSLPTVATPHTYTRVYLCIHVYICKHISEKEPNKRDNILQKRPIILRNLLIIATPTCIYISERKELLAQQPSQLSHFRVYTCIFAYTHVYTHVSMCIYGVATFGRLLKIISLFCKRAL